MLAAELARHGIGIPPAEVDHHRIIAQGLKVLLEPLRVGEELLLAHAVAVGVETIPAHGRRQGQCFAGHDAKRHAGLALRLAARILTTCSPLASSRPVMIPVFASRSNPSGRPAAENVSGLSPVVASAWRKTAPGQVPTARAVQARRLGSADPARLGHQDGS